VREEIETEIRETFQDEIDDHIEGAHGRPGGDGTMTEADLALQKVEARAADPGFGRDLSSTVSSEARPSREGDPTMALAVGGTGPSSTPSMSRRRDGHPPGEAACRRSSDPRPIPEGPNGVTDGVHRSPARIWADVPWLA
jgi:hypothetical protein